MGGENMDELARKRLKEGKPNYGRLGNWAIEHFEKEKEEGFFEIEKSESEKLGNP